MKTYSKIKEALSKLIEETFERISTDKGIIALDGTLEELEVGTGVYFVYEEDEEVPAEDGEYKLEDGRILRVEESKVVEIIEAEPETPAEEEKPEETTETAAEETPEKEPEVENPTNTEEETDTEAIVKLREEVNELYELVHKLEDRIAELEGKPAASPAEEEFRKDNENTTKAVNAHQKFLMNVAKA